MFIQRGRINNYNLKKWVVNINETFTSSQELCNKYDIRSILSISETESKYLWSVLTFGLPAGYGRVAATSYDNGNNVLFSVYCSSTSPRKYYGVATNCYSFQFAPSCATLWSIPSSPEHQLATIHTQASLEKKTFEQLKALLRDSGNKPDLIQRILAHDLPSAQAQQEDVINQTAVNESTMEGKPPPNQLYADYLNAVETSNQKWYKCYFHYKVNSWSKKIILSLLTVLVINSRLNSEL